MAIRNYAQEAFSSDTPGPLNLIPRQKFNFTLFLETHDGRTIEMTRISNVTTPGYQFETTILSQYNKKRVVQTKMNYDLVTATFYDTFDNEFHNLMRDYIQHYYNTGQGIEEYVDVEGDSVVNPSFITNYGYSAVSTRYFFSKIIIRQNGLAGTERKTVLKNPMIVSIQGDTLDYSDSQSVMYTVQFQPESITTLDSADVAE